MQNETAVLTEDLRNELVRMKRVMKTVATQLSNTLVSVEIIAGIDGGYRYRTGAKLIPEVIDGCRITVSKIEAILRRGSYSHDEVRDLLKRRVATAALMQELTAELV